MKIQDQVCGLPQAKKLKELGITQDSYFSWCGDESIKLLDNGVAGLAVSNWVFVSSTEPVNNQELDYRHNVPSAKPFAAAFSVSELGIMLHGCISGCFQFEGKPVKAYCTPDEWYPYDLSKVEHLAQPDPEPLPWYKERLTEADARAELLIFLLENNLETVDAVNIRYTNY